MNNTTAHTLTVSNKGQVVIPSAIREALGISFGSTVEVTQVGNQVSIALKSPRPQSTVEAGFGMLKYSGQPRLLADVDVAALMRKNRSDKEIGRASCRERVLMPV